MWSIPRKPQRNPKPSADDVSGSHENAESLSASFSMASRSVWYSAESTGKMPEYTICWTCLKPFKGTVARRLACVTVSPTATSRTALMPQMSTPTSPTDRPSTMTSLGVLTRISRTSNSPPDSMK